MFILYRLKSKLGCQILTQEKETKSFRSMRRLKQELPKEECFEILTKEKRGVLSVLGDFGYPYAIPINFYFDSKRERIYFHCALAGHKIDALKAKEKICFTVYEQGIQKEDWSYHVRSVVLFGRARLVLDEELKYEETLHFGMKYYPSKEEVEHEIEKDYHRMNLFEIEIEHMTGKIVHEK